MGAIQHSPLIERTRARAHEIVAFLKTQRRYGELLYQFLRAGSDAYMQAESKTAPTNPMKELRIDKLVISAYFAMAGDYIETYALLSRQISQSGSLVIVSPVLQRSWSNSLVKHPSLQKHATLCVRSAFVVTKRSQCMLLSAGRRRRRSSSEG